MISKPINEHDWRASLVPAAAVIPAPIAYTNAVAVKKLVVGFRFGCCKEAPRVAQCQRFMPSGAVAPRRGFNPLRSTTGLQTRD